MFDRPYRVMAGLVPAIHALVEDNEIGKRPLAIAPLKSRRRRNDVGGRDKPGHDGFAISTSASPRSDA